MEKWTPVLGFEKLYEVSNSGKVRRISRGKVLTAEQIDKAKQMFAEGATLKQVASFLNVSITTAHSIKQSKTWAGDSAFRLCKTTVLKGYEQISFCKDGVYTRRAVHRVVWESFVGPISKGLEINHKDLNRSNNSLDNLELVTHRQNLQHAIDHYKAQGLLRAVKGVTGFIAGKHSVYDNK